MSQNQSYFWQTTRRNVYLKRSAKWHMLMALMVVLTFSTICAEELKLNMNDDMPLLSGVQTNMGDDIALNRQMEQGVVENKPTESSKKEVSQGGFGDAFTASISVILLTELGDKTFFIAAIMAMRHPRLIVFTGAIAALALMTILSCVFGMAAMFIDKRIVYYTSTALFFIFGLKMLWDAYKMKPGDAQEELEEVQSDLRRREDELLRKYEDTESKRKNSNSDKEDVSEQALIHGGSGDSSATTNPATTPSNASEMQHRQRKQRINNNNNNNNSNVTAININNSKRNSCDRTGCDDDYHGRVEHESEVFLKDGGRVVEQLKMTTFHSPAHSASIASSHTEQTFCDSPRNNLTSNDTVDIAAASMAATTLDALAGNKFNANTNAAGKAPLAGHESLHGSLNGSCGSLDAESKANGSVKTRLDRDVNAALVHDPESGGTRRRNAPRRSAAYFTMRIFAQAFTMTFLAEWGDRSQLTTILLAASKDVYGIIIGGILGHCICTGLAVIGGRLVATKISVRTVTIMGGIVFIGFAIYALALPPEDLDEPNAH